MPRVEAAFELRGRIAALATGDDATFKFVVLDTGMLVVTVKLQPTTRELDTIIVQGGQAQLDLFESTDTTKVYTCRFQVVQYNDCEAEILDCAARLTPGVGLRGRWNRGGERGQSASEDHAFALSWVRDCQASETDPASRGTRSALAPGTYTFAGDAVDRRKSVYATMLVIELLGDGRVTGHSTESGKHCNVTGTWAGSVLSYRLEYPVEEEFYMYAYRGTLQKTTTGPERLIGTWEYEKVSEDEHEIDGTFDFKLEGVEPRVDITRAVPATGGAFALPVTDRLVPGTFVYTGSATSNGGTEYASTLTLELIPDGSLRGRSEELSVVPQECQLTGTWVDNRIQYALVYTNGSTVTYQYDGVVVQGRLTGTWTNPRVADSYTSEHGRFEFVRQEPEVAASTKDNTAASTTQKSATVVTQEQPVVASLNEVTDTPAVPTVECLVAGSYVLDGFALSDGGCRYDSTLTLVLHADGSLTGESSEAISIAPQLCKVEGKWKPNLMRYRMTYTDSRSAEYSYVCRFTENQLIGRWKNVIKQDRGPSEEGGFEFTLRSHVAATETEAKSDIAAPV